MMYRCPFEGCQYQNLQKSNVNTHISTHTGEKPHACPDCEFRTADPGSLTRHRKRTHGYVPKKSSLKAKPVGTKQSRRHTPYKRHTSEESVSAWSSSSSEAIPEELLDISTFMASLPPTCVPLDMTCDAPRDNQYSYTWDKDLFRAEEPCASLNLESYTPPTSSPVPRHIFPAAGACQQLENIHEYNFDFMDAFLDQYPLTPLLPAAQLDFPATSPTDSNITQPQTTSVPGSQWTADPFMTDVPVQSYPTNDALDFSCNMFCSDGFFYGSPSTSSSSSSPSDFSSFDSPSPSSSYSAPSPCDSFFDDLPSAGLSLLGDSLDFVFPDPISVC